KNSTAGKMFIQALVRVGSGEAVLRHAVIGNDFAIIAWGVDPKWRLTAENLQKGQKQGGKLMQVHPAIQVNNQQRQHYEQITTIGDMGTDIRAWFGQTSESVVILRPDRFVAALAIPQTLNSISQQLFNKLSIQV